MFFTYNKKKVLTPVPYKKKSSKILVHSIFLPPPQKKKITCSVSPFTPLCPSTLFSIYLSLFLSLTFILSPSLPLQESMSSFVDILCTCLPSFKTSPSTTNWGKLNKINSLRQYCHHLCHTYLKNLFKIYINYEYN